MSDEYFEELFNELNIDPDIRCAQGNKIERMCLNPNCPVAMICSNSKCIGCGKNAHWKCNKKAPGWNGAKYKGKIKCMPIVHLLGLCY